MRRHFRPRRTFIVSFLIFRGHFRSFPLYILFIMYMHIFFFSRLKLVCKVFFHHLEEAYFPYKAYLEIGLSPCCFGRR